MSEHSPFRHLTQSERERFIELTNEELIMIALSSIIAETLPGSPYNSALRQELLGRAFVRLNENDPVNRALAYSNQKRAEERAKDGQKKP